MKSKVYFVPVHTDEAAIVRKQKLERLLMESQLFAGVSSKASAVIKMHFGEEGNTGFVNPSFVRVINDALLKRGVSPVVSDTNTLYRGRRLNSKDHTALAYEHGFTKDLINADVIIPDDNLPENVVEVDLNGKYVKKARIARLFAETGHLIGLAHFKGHLMTGFGGALKNIGMGCAVRQGKLFQHSDVSPFSNKKRCTGCGACVLVCPVKAIQMQEAKAFISKELCIGCASCVAACKFNAIDINWEAGGNKIQEKMAEYAYAVLKERADRSAFVNFALKITKECDCLAKDDPSIAPDIGILASFDPVALDKASLDLTLKACGKDIFKEVHPKRDGMRQLKHAAAIGVGTMEYELIKCG